MSNEDLKNFVLKWNIRYPVDRWWREKYNIPFNSEAHRVSNFIDMSFQFEEDSLYNRIRNGKEINEEETYIAGTGNFLKKREVKIDVDKAFEDLSLDD